MPLQAHAASTESSPETITPGEHVTELSLLTGNSGYPRKRVLDIAEHYATYEVSFASETERSALLYELKSAAQRHGLEQYPHVIAAIEKIHGPSYW